MDEFEYSFKLPREWVGLSLLKAVMSGLLGCFRSIILVPGPTCVLRIAINGKSCSVGVLLFGKELQYK